MNPRHVSLFEPLQIGPVTAKNRFYQVPHCTGMGYQRPNTVNRMREVNAEGGWGVVCTEYCSIHPSADESPFAQCSLWDEDDVRVLGNMVERVHAYDALAGVELWYGGFATGNLATREPSMAPSSMPTWEGWAQTQAMSKRDLAQFRNWHKDAVARALRAGFDIIYVYAGHGYMPAQFLSPVFNQRADEYGGSFENRARLIKELLLDTHDVVAGKAAVALRFAVDNLDEVAGITCTGDGRALVEHLADIPDLWDVNVANFAGDARTSRFAPEGAQEDYVAFVKQLTSKPVVGVGRFTSPDTMVSQLRRGVLDLIGAARPSIADPFLPNKVAAGDVEAIRECIGCNMCIGANNSGVPLHCTQNPTRGEEWRRGWHPEVISSRHAEQTVLVIGAGPSGLEAARALSLRGYDVRLAERSQALGGRVAAEASLPGLQAWIRVRDYRTHYLHRAANVEIYIDSEMTAADVLECGFQHVCVATGATWRNDGVGRSSYTPLVLDADAVCGVEALMVGDAPRCDGPVVVFDDEHFYLGAVVAERMRELCDDVTLVTSANEVSPFTKVTLEQHRVQARVLDLGIRVVTAERVISLVDGILTTEANYGGYRRQHPCALLVPVTARMPNEALFNALVERNADWADAGVQSVVRIGDCVAPSAIEAAVFAGHRYARELGEPAPVVARDRPHIAGD